MVKKFSRLVNEYPDETALMEAVYARKRPGRPVKGQHNATQYTISWNDLRRIYAALKLAHKYSTNEQADDALREAARSLHKRTAGRLELMDGEPIADSGRPAALYAVTWPDGETEQFRGAAAAAQAIGVTPGYISQRTADGGTLVKHKAVWDSATRSNSVVEITVRRLTG